MPAEGTVIEEGDLDTGEHWLLTAGGTDDDFATFIEIVHSDGRREAGGFRGPVLHPGRMSNTCVGCSDIGPLRLLGRVTADVAKVHLELDGELLELPLLGADDVFAVRFFVALLPKTSQVSALVLLDVSGHELERHPNPFSSLRRRYRNP